VVETEPSFPWTRRWPRQRAITTMLAVFPGRECLGRTLDLSQEGIGAVLQGTDHREGERVKVVAAFPRGTVGFRGIVAYSAPLGKNSRIGVRLLFPPVPEARGRPAHLPSHLQPQRPSVPWATRGDGRAALPARVNTGLRFPLLSPEDARAMHRDRERLLEELRAKGYRCDRHLYESLLQAYGEQDLRELRAPIARELFRMAMERWYPSFPGTTVSGRLIPPVPRQQVPPDAVVVLDRFAVTRVSPEGEFAAHGIPVLDRAAHLPLRIRSSGPMNAARVDLHLAAGKALELRADLQVNPQAAALQDGGALAKAFKDLCAMA